ncbi:hypothetical protein V1264_022156 [Littorina saxatilis]
MAPALLHGFAFRPPDRQGFNMQSPWAQFRRPMFPSQNNGQFPHRSPFCRHPPPPPPGRGDNPEGPPSPSQNDEQLPPSYSSGDSSPSPPPFLLGAPDNVTEIILARLAALQQALANGASGSEPAGERQSRQV